MGWSRASIGKKYPAALQPVFPPEDIELHKNEDRVQPRRDVIDGASCVVLERPGATKFWLDPARGYAVIRADIFWPATKDRAALPRFTRQHSEFKELKPQLWLPMKIVEDLYTDPGFDSKPDHGKHVASWTMTISAASFAPLDDDFFRAKISLGRV